MFLSLCGGKKKAEATKGGTIGKGEDGGAIKSCGDPKGKAHDDEPKIFSDDSEAQNKSDGDPEGKAHGTAHDDEPPKILPNDGETKRMYRTNSDAHLVTREDCEGLNMEHPEAVRISLMRQARRLNAARSRLLAGAAAGPGGGGVAAAGPSGVAPLPGVLPPPGVFAPHTPPGEPPGPALVPLFG